MSYVTKERLYFTADRSKVVRSGDPAAAFLFAGVGKEISDADAERYGIGRKAAPKPEGKAVEAPEDKAVDVPENKAVSGLTVTRGRRKGGNR